jgi:hypothetical protein
VPGLQLWLFLAFAKRIEAEREQAEQAQQNRDCRDQSEEAHIQFHRHRAVEIVCTRLDASMVAICAGDENGTATARAAVR